MSETLVTELMGEAAARQGARRLAVSEFRARRATAAVCAALLVTVTGTLTAAVAIANLPGARLDAAPLVRGQAQLHRLTWQQPGVLAVAAVIAAVGLVLFLAAVVPGRFRMEPLRGYDPRLAGALSRAALRRSLALAATNVPGITRAQVRLTARFRRKAVIRAATHYRNPANLAELVRVAANTRLGRIEPLRSRRVIVRLSWRKS